MLETMSVLWGRGYTFVCCVCVYMCVYMSVWCKSFLLPLITDYPPSAIRRWPYWLWTTPTQKNAVDQKRPNRSWPTQPHLSWTAHWVTISGKWTITPSSGTRWVQWGKQTVQCNKRVLRGDAWQQGRSSHLAFWENGGWAGPFLAQWNCLTRFLYKNIIIWLIIGATMTKTGLLGASRKENGPMSCLKGKMVQCVRNAWADFWSQSAPSWQCWKVCLNSFFSVIQSVSMYA